MAAQKEPIHDLEIKISMICKSLGRLLSRSKASLDSPANEIYEFLDNGLYLSLHTNNPYSTVEVGYQGEIVYYADLGAVGCYVSGAWEKKLDKLYKTIK